LLEKAVHSLQSADQQGESMKRAAMVAVILGLGASTWAQQTSAPQNPPAAPAGTAQSPAPPAAKRLPQAKTQPEYQAYQAAMAKANDPAALEAAANDFATKFPDSELRVLLFKTDMGAYRSANNGDKMMEMGRKVLAIDPDSPEALLGVAEILVEHTHETDLDKTQRWAEAEKLLQHSLETIDTDIVVPPNTPQEKVDAFKADLRSRIYSYLGTLAFNQEKYPEAEGYYRKSLDAFPSQPDAVVVLRLALVLDKQGRYADALKEADQAVELMPQQSPSLTDAAQREHDRLVQLTGGIPSSSPTPPANAPTPAAPKN
jgi:tetratricopeptide (TPR) repeat protein